MTRPDRPVLSIVIPVFCEEDQVERTIEEVCAELNALGEGFELIVIDDGSTDGTWSILTQMAAGLPVLRAARLSRNFGKEAAISAGLRMARGHAVVVMDGDLQHPPSLIPRMVSIWSETNADIVEAVKQRGGAESKIGRLRARLFYTVLNRLSGYDLDGASDFKLLDRKVVDAWLDMEEHNLFFRGMIAWLGYRRVQIPFAVPLRTGGRTKWTTTKLLKLAVNGVTAFSSLPLQLVTAVGFVFAVFSIVLGVQTLAMKVSGEAVDGFTTVILLLLIIGSLLMFSLGIIGSYVARIFEEVKRRPRYVIAQMLNEEEALSGTKTPLR